MPMNAPRDHHFIPAFYLKGWTAPDGKLVEYAKKGSKLIAKPVGPRATGFERDLYAFPELPRDQAQFMEQVFFAYADQKASDALDNHLGQATHQWTSELVSAWSRFVIGVHLRHPDAMPELRTAAQSIWASSGDEFQERYEKLRQPGDPVTFDEMLKQRDPLTSIKMQANLIIKALDNEFVGTHLNQMKWATIDVSASPVRLLTSDRPVEIFNLKEPNGVLSIPVSPAKIFVAVNEDASFEELRASAPQTIVAHVNTLVVSRARRFVWASDEAQEPFIAAHMSTKLEPTPFFPNAAKV